MKRTLIFIILSLATKDNFLLELAIDSKSDYIITGDNDLLELKIFYKTRIITYTDFVKLI